MSEKIKYTIRKARLADMERVFLLSNDAAVRQQSIHPQTITLEQHVQWFTRKINDPDYVFLVVYDQQKQFIGQVRYEVKNKSAVITISINRDFRGKGLAVPLLKATAARVFKLKPDLTEIIAYIKPDNVASSRSFLRAGYARGAQRQQAIINDIPFEVFILKRKV
jgi:RimJ/RimL family protein N-acetyltransferase